MMKTTIAAGAAAVFAPAACGGSAVPPSKAAVPTKTTPEQRTDRLSWEHVPAGENGFFRAPVLVTGKSEAVLIDGGFTYADGQATVERIRASSKRLTTIYVSQSDPDYYFNLKPIKEAFPDVQVIAAPAVVTAINANVDKKLAVWGPKLGANGPQTRADVVIPEAADDTTLMVDGETIEIVDAHGLANRRYLFVPSLNAVFGGVLIFAGVHVWLADTPTKEGRLAWLANLESIAARKPEIIVPGHMTPGFATDLSSLEHTRAYLVAFEEELAQASDSAALQMAMEARFPGLGMSIALDIGAKVATGEMTWG